MRKILFIISLACFSTIGWSQMDTTITLISKIDDQADFELHDGFMIRLMGYTQTIGGFIDLPSPTLNLTEGDSVLLNLWNLSQGPPHTIHLHGLDVDQANDGVPQLSFAVEHDDTGQYIFEAPHAGTYLYHCHETSVLHVQSGMYGMLIIRPQSADTLTWEGGYSFHSENTWMMSEIDTTWHNDSIINHPHDTTTIVHLIRDYLPQHFLINGKSETQIDGSDVEIQGSVNEIIYLRLANIGYHGNRVIIPSELNANVVASDGRPLPASIQSDTVEVLPGERYGVLLQANQELLDSIEVNYFDLNTQQNTNSQFAQVSIQGMLGTEEMVDSGVQLELYPNPSSGSFQMRISSRVADRYELNIYDVLGQLVANQTVNLQEGTSVFQVEGKTPKSGIYSVQIVNNGHSITKKILITK